MPKKVMLISNDTCAHAHIVQALENTGYSVLSISFYSNMLTLIHEETPDLIILDADQMDAECVTFIEQLKADVALTKIPIIRIVDSSYNYLVKPIEPEVLQSKVHKIIGRSDSDTAQKKVVIIDDEIDLCKTLAYRFKKWGFQVHISHDGKSGYHIIAKEVPDLIILDLHLPGLTGEEVCKKVRKNEHTESIPIIMLTAKNSDVDRIIGKVIGATAYITKPFQVEELSEQVQKLTHNTRE